MRRRSHGRGRSPAAGFSVRLLRRRCQRIFESEQHASIDAESVASILLKCHPEYLRNKRFSDEVSQVLASLRHPPTTAATSHDNTSSARDDTASSATTCTRLSHQLSHSSSESDESQSTSSTSEEDHPDPKPVFDVGSTIKECYLKINSTPKPRPLRRTDQPASAKTRSVKNRREVNMDIDVVVKKKRKVVATNNGPVSEGGANKGYNGNSEGQKGKVGLRFADLGGMKGVIEKLEDMIRPFRHPKVARYIGIEPISGLLLHGPPGCGKTTLAHAIANEMGVPFYKISAPEIVSGVSGESEENIRSLFNKAHRTTPSIVFIDEIDAIASKRENLQREMEQRIVTQLMTCMDQFHQTLQDQNPDPSRDKPPGYVLVIGATNRPDAVDQALRRPGRFDREIELGVPDESARAEILSMLTQRVRLEGKIDLLKIARLTPGFAGADLKSLVDMAGSLAMERIFAKRDPSLNLEDEAEMESLCISITMADFEEAAKIVQPCLRREGFSTIPNVTWDDVGGLSSIKEVFERYIFRPMKYPEVCKKLRIKSKAGFLLFGPPGCGKTLIAKAVANEAGANFIHIKGSELLNKYVGESESEVIGIFRRARTNSPCIIFFDEVDALTSTRGGEEGGGVVGRLLNQLLIELDGADHREGVYVIGATNRIETMDPAVLRAGRFGNKIYVPLPDADERVAIMKALTRNRPLDADVDLDSLVRTERCNNLTGADLEALVDKAAHFALEEHTANETNTSYECITFKAPHFERALSGITPTVSDEQREHFEALANKYRAK